MSAKAYKLFLTEMLRCIQIVYDVFLDMLHNCYLIVSLCIPIITCRLGHICLLVYPSYSINHSVNRIHVDGSHSVPQPPHGENLLLPETKAV